MATATQPKKPQAAYFNFCNEKRQDIFKEIGANDIAKAGKRAGEMWKSMSEAEKEPYESKAKVAKEEYEKAMQTFKEGGGIVEKRTPKKTSADEKPAKRARDENAPKRPPCAYFLFSNENREKIFTDIGSRDFGQAGKRAGEMWKAMSEAEKEPYESRAKVAKEEFEKTVEEYKQTESYAAAQAAKTVKSSPIKTTQPVAKRAQAATTAKSSPIKTAQPVAKRARKTNAAGDDNIVGVDAATLAEAGELAGALKNLAARPEAKGKTSQEILKALRSSDGIVNKAKHLLSA